MHLPFLADFSLFVGRFHPLVVHLPIGFLLLAVVLEWWPGQAARPAVRIAWWLGGVSAVVAAGCGWLLASAGGGGGDTLFWHRWSGVTVAILSVGGIFIAGREGTLAKGYGLPVTTPGGTHALYFVVHGEGGGKLMALNAIGYEPVLPGADTSGVEVIEKYISELLAARDSITTPVMVETSGASRRENHLFERGNWLVPGEEVSGGVPE